MQIMSGMIWKPEALHAGGRLPPGILEEFMELACSRSIAGPQSHLQEFVKLAKAVPDACWQAH